VRANTNPNFRYHPPRLIIKILMLLFVSLETIDFILEAFDVVYGALEDRSLVRLSYVEILNKIVDCSIDCSKIAGPNLT
jgi:hypothetical protein